MARGDYDHSAEFHEVFMEPVWDRLAPVLAQAFGHLGPDSVVVDLGAGSGVGLERLSRVCPGRLIAVEPGPVMRAMLTGRVSRDSGLSSRTTIHAGAAPDVLPLLPSRIDGLLAAHLLGHLEPDERRQLFRWLTVTLPPTGVGLVTVTPPVPHPPGGHPEQVETRRIGDHEYRATHCPAKPNRYRTRYEVRQDRVTLRELTAEGRWLDVGWPTLAADLSGTDLVAVPAGVSAVLLIPGPSPRRPSS